jgi:hypothetical protein
MVGFGAISAAPNAAGTRNGLAQGHPKFDVSENEKKA